MTPHELLLHPRIGEVFHVMCGTTQMPSAAEQLPFYEYITERKCAKLIQATDEMGCAQKENDQEENDQEENHGGGQWTKPEQRRNRREQWTEGRSSTFHSSRPPPAPRKRSTMSRDRRITKEWTIGSRMKALNMKAK